ncbi:hypothetical protein [Aquaticitalea lipolytica]|uniref:hypothetical protein n=1 Tax=Aquaticitalea lipolytica TaxID=1247562 RepID=UPI001668036A|nr:hypothetical protein [Aquaticitalea lipolytica]
MEIAKASQKKEIDEIKDEDFKVYEVGDTKTIDFILLDGTRQNFPYSHYLTSWLGVENEERVIKIFFATHMVTVKGFCLELLYDYLIKFSLKTLRVTDKRYLQKKDEANPLIKNVIIVWKKESQN